MTKHTPGPWKVDLWEDGRLDVISDHSDMTICEVTTRIHVEPPPNLSEYEEHQANASLIADAPETAAERDRLKALNAELVEALKTSNDALSTLAGCWHCADKVNFLKLLGDNNDAIAEAVGSND